MTALAQQPNFANSAPCAEPTWQGLRGWRRSVQFADDCCQPKVIDAKRGWLSLPHMHKSRLDFPEPANREVLEPLAAWMEQGALKPHIAEILSLDQIAEAHRTLETPEHIGKIVLSHVR